MSLLSQFIDTLGAVTPAAQAERTRSQKADDQAFTVADYLYYFELVLPASLMGKQAQSFLIPLVLGPQAISLDEPFAVEMARTQGAGLYVEEQGIIERTLRISGNTGWAPIPLPIRQSPGFITAGLKLDRSYSRTLPQQIVTALSGKRHFEYINDAFRTYADAKRDPAHAAGTKMFFHNPRDDEDWEVKPRSFSLSRSTSNTLGYPYNIELTVVGPATYAPIATLTSLDNGVLTNMRNALVAAQNFVSLGTAYLNQLTAVEAQMRRVFKNMGAVVNSCTSLLTAAASFVSGAASLIQAPYALVAQTCVLIEGSLAAAEAAGRTAGQTGSDYAGIPALYIASWRRLVDNVMDLGTHPESFASNTQASLALVRLNQNLLASVGADAIGQASSAANPTSFAQATALGSQLLAADAVESSVQQNTQTTPVAYTGTSTYTVQQGDTLVGIASRLMGDARLWVYLAVANGLTLPLGESVSTKLLATSADTDATAGLLSLGQTLYIPNYTQPTSSLPDLPVLGVPTTAPAATQVLGADFALTFNQGTGTLSGDTDTLVDLAVNEATNDDCAVVAGAANLQQAILIRLNTELGSDQLMPQLGLQPIVGTGLAAADAQAVQYRVKATLLADPRVAAVTDLTLDNNAGPDQLFLTGTVQVLGLGDGVAFSAT